MLGTIQGDSCGHTTRRQIMRGTTSHDYGGRSVDGILFYRNQSFVGLLEWECSHLRLQTNLARDLEKISSVSTRHVGDTPQLALAPQQAIVVKLRNPVQVNSVDGNHSSLSQTSERCYYHIATRSKSHGAVKLRGRPVGLTSDPNCAQRSC